MRRPNYGAVTGVTVAMAVLGFVRVAFQGLIPPPHPEIAGWGRGEFVRRAQSEDVDWLPADRRAFDRAQRLSRPMLVVVGLPWSALGRQADQSFLSSEVARALNRGFVPIRVDAAQDPRWLSQFLPLERVRMGFSVGFQAWAFDLKGRLIAFIGRLDAQDSLDESTVLRGLLDAQAKFGEAALSDAEPELQATQSRDADRLLNPGVVTLSLSDAARSLLGRLDRAWGGWNMRGLVGARPLAFRFLQLAGDAQETGEALRRAVLSPRADWLDGGFYRIVRREDGIPEYDKSTLANAQFAEALAVQNALRPDRLLRTSAERTIRWILGLRTGAFVPGAEQGDEDERGRSARASFSPRRLREAVDSGRLSPADAGWATANLGLAPPARTVLPRPAAAEDARLPSVVEALRRNAGPPRARVAPALADVNGAVAACLLRCARLLDDRELAASAGGIVDQMDQAFRRPQGVVHTLGAGPDDGLLLSDALAYADAALQDFLTNGRAPSLERGAGALRAALATFGEPDRSMLRPSPPGAELLHGLPLPLPQVTDDECEASSATALRLVDAYATILGPNGGDLAAWADRMQDRLGSVTEASPVMGGALGALARHLDSRAVFVVGPGASARAARLARAFPNRLVVPVLGVAHPDLATRAPGVYVCAREAVMGPFAEGALVERLPRDLEVGR